ncbi:MAG: AlkZ-related protein, partial [Blastocatellia bacterium]
MPTTSNKDFNRVMKTLEDHGLLLASDARLPSVAGIVAGEPIKGSWWAHPKCHEIFRINVRLEETGKVIVCKLISGKQTFVHRRLWPAIAAIGMSRERWQINGLSPAARKLLKIIDDEGEVRTNVLSKEKPGEGKAITAATRELE